MADPRLRSALAALALLLVALPPAAAFAPPEADAPAERYLVGFHDMPALKKGHELHGAPVVDVVDGLFVVVEPGNAALFHARALLDENVRHVERDDPHYGRALFVPNDARYGDAGHYGSKIIGAETAWDRTLGATSVKVAVIDSGVRRTHEDLAGGRVLQGWDFVSNDNNPEDNCGHGTHVMGTIGATIHNGKGIAGMAQASLLPLRGLSSSLLGCTGSTSALASGLKYAADQGSHLSSNSWGGGTSTSVADAIAYAHGKGTIQLAAAGNDGPCSNCVGEPWKSNADKVIIVASTTSGDAQSSFSSEGPQVDVSAPGSNILSLYTSNDASYTTMSGTSMATPHVTGLAALLKTLNPAWTFADVDARLKSTAKDLGAAGVDHEFGAGRIDAAAATAGSSPPPSNGAPTACFAATTSGLTASVDGACSSDPEGGALSYAWDFGDGSTATGKTASRTYAAAGTYTVRLTVTDGAGATGTTTKSVTVSSTSDPDPSTPTLTSGVATSARSGSAGTSQYYKIQVPSGAARLDVVLDGPACGLLGCSADLDLYVRKDAKPTDTLYDCRPYEGDSDEACALTNPGAAWWYVRVYVYSGSAGDYTIKATVA